MNTDNKKKHREIILYIVFGVLTTAVNWAAYSLLVKLLNVSIPKSQSAFCFSEILSKTTEGVYIKLFACNIFAWMVAVIFAFITNKLFVFESRRWHFKVLLKEITVFVGTRAFTGILESAGHTALVAAGFNYKLFGIDGFLAKIFVSIVVVILNYIFSKFFVFRNKKR